MVAVREYRLCQNTMSGRQQRNVFCCGLLVEQKPGVILYNAGGFSVGEDEIRHTKILAKERERR